MTATRQTVALSVGNLVDRARRLAEAGGRTVLGITGAPGAGKTTIASRLAAELGPQLCVLVPMDGFHLCNATLRAWGRRERKGAWDTFDVEGYLHLLGRLRDQTDEVVHAPDFDRHLDEPIACAIPVARAVPLVITEGNWLLCREGPWQRVKSMLDDSWYLHVDDPTRQHRLVGRHQQHGMTEAQAVSWTAGTDQANAELVADGRDRADLTITVVAS